MGKSALAGQICYHIAKLHGLPVNIFSLEMSRKQLLYRQMSLETGIGLSALRSGRIGSEQWGKLSTGIGDAVEPPVFVAENTMPTVEQMWAGLKRFKEEHGELGTVMIDYLQLMEGSGDNRVQALSGITRNLKLMARDLDVPIIALSQLSRGVESRTNKRPMMSDLRDSGSLEQDADVVMMLYREEYYDPETPDRGIAELNVTKNRNGAPGTVKLLFEPEFTRFRNLAA
jgi:replicative DNA helicase